MIGLLVALAIDPGNGIAQAVPKDFKAKDIPTFSQVILDLVPSNPISDMASGKVVPVLIFAIFVAVAIVQVGSKKPEVVAPVKSFILSYCCYAPSC